MDRNVANFYICDIERDIFCVDWRNGCSTNRLPEKTMTMGSQTGDLISAELQSISTNLTSPRVFQQVLTANYIACGTVLYSQM